MVLCHDGESSVGDRKRGPSEVGRGRAVYFGDEDRHNGALSIVINQYAAGKENKILIIKGSIPRASISLQSFYQNFRRSFIELNLLM